MKKLASLIIILTFTILSNYSIAGDDGNIKLSERDKGIYSFRCQICYVLVGTPIGSCYWYTHERLEIRDKNI